MLPVRFCPWLDPVEPSPVEPSPVDPNLLAGLKNGQKKMM
jgi:hypothetical protein